MKTQDFRSLPPAGQEQLRRKAVDAVLGGMTIVQAARVFGVTRQAVGSWMERYETAGARALKAQPRGRPRGTSRLLPWQAAQTARAVVDRCPNQLKLPFWLWTREAVGELITRRYGVKLSVWTVGRMLRRWGFTPQKPVRRAFEQNPEEVRRWLREVYPGIRAEAKRQKAESSDAQIEREAAASAAGAAGRLGNSPTDGPRADPEVTKEKITEAVKNLDDFDFNTFREMMMKDIINNADQQKIIESRCKAMDVSDLIVNGFVTQKVPIIPGKFEPEFRSMSGAEDLAIKRLIMLEGKGAEVSDRYLLDKFSMMAVVVGIHALNNNPLPSHLDKDGTFDDDAFWKKFNMVVRYPFHLLASLGVNYFWFEIRVRQLFVAEKLGNG